MLRYFFAVTATVLMALPAASEPYRLIVGDKVIVNYDFLDEAKQTIVDLDGNIRLSEVGSIPAAGQTLDEIEEAIGEKMILGGFSGVSFVLVEVSEYAPVVVSGFVERSGRFDFIPGMDVGAAVALAGGVGGGEIEGPNADILSVNARRKAATAAERIADAVADIARLEAALAGPDTQIELNDALRSKVPVSQRDTMDERIEAERLILEDQRQTAEALVASWSSDVVNFEKQTVLLEQRIVIKTETIESLTSELADLEKLRSQGLTTTARFSTQQQRLSDDREELLSLETAKITAGRAATLAERNRDRFLSDRREQNYEDLQDAQSVLAIGISDYNFALDEIAVLSNDTAALSEEEEIFDIRYRIRGPRADRLAETEVTLQTPLLPGDIVVVEFHDISGGSL